MTTTGFILLCLLWSPAWGEEQTGEEPSLELESAAEEEETKVATLLDEDATKDMHDDSTLLRNVRVFDEDALVLFDALRIWVGGALQYDYYNFDGIFNSTEEGDRREGANFRRMEGIVRAQLYDWGELKAQYDFDDGIFRDLYLRWVSERPNTPVTITIGNQKEPIGLDDLSGNKVGIAQERSAPTHAFGTWRSKGIRLHRAFQLDREDRRFDFFAEDMAFVTTSIGLFTQDIEDSHDTDIALTGRITAGRNKDNVGMHVGFAASYREGEFDRVSFRPEVREASRVVLARPLANTQGIAGVEAAYNNGRLHFQGEAFYSQYAGRVDGYGAGGYLQAGWFLTADSRDYNSRWGIMAPHRSSNRLSAELFARVSHTRGDDDDNGWNDYKSITLGGNMYYRKARGSLNVVYGESREPVITEDEGLAVVIRAQYLF